MTSGQKFCIECGTALVPAMKFCGQCGQRVTGLNPASQEHQYQSPLLQTVATSDNPERIFGIVPFVEQGLLSVIHYTLLVTPRRLIFCTWNADTDEAMSDADDEVALESCTIAETKNEIIHFRAKDWATGPWQRYLTMPIDTIGPGAPGSITIPMDAITGVDIICETQSSTQDKLSIDTGARSHAFDLMYSQGPFLFSLLMPLLGEKVSIADQLHKRRSLDRLLTGQEYK